MLAVREARGESQQAFARAAEKELGVIIDPSKVSKMESGGKQQMIAEDIVIIAAMDRERRGREWLTFGVREELQAPPVEELNRSQTSTEKAAKGDRRADPATLAIVGSSRRTRLGKPPKRES